MHRLAYKLYRWAAASQHWTRRRFTPAGQFVMVCLIVSAVLGLDTDLTLAYQVFTLCFALLLVAYLSSLFFRRRFQATRALPPFVTAGEGFAYRLRLSNPGPRTHRDLEILESLEDPRPDYGEFRTGAPPWWKRQLPHWRKLVRKARGGEIEPQQLALLGPRQDAEVLVSGKADRRGYIRFSAVTVGRADPLGLCRSLINLPCPQHLLVLPRRYAIPPLRLPGVRIYQHGGVTLAASKGDSEEFVGLRDYRPGDPLQKVHWKSFARIGKPVVKEYQDEYFERHALVLDTVTDESGETVFEEAVSLAASFVCTLETQENLLDLMFVGDRAYTFTAGVGQLHSDSMLEVLAGVQYRPDGDLQELRMAVLEQRSRLSGCILILLAWDQSRRDLVEELTALGLPLQVYLIADDKDDPLEDPSPGLQVLQVGEIEQGLAGA